MTQPNKVTKLIHPFSLAKRMWQGASIAFILITVFLIAAGTPDPSWGWAKLWMIRPLLVVSLAGAIAGAFYYFMDPMRYQGGWRKVSASILCLIVGIIVLWLGAVLGLDGTWWD